MGKILPLCLCVILLLLGVVAEVMFLSGKARAQVDGIIVEGQDDTSMITSEYSAELANVTSGVTSRVVVEYGDFNSKLDLNISNGLNQVAGTVSLRITVEYADFISTYGLQGSETLTHLATTVTAGIIVEYADQIFSTDLEVIPEFPSTLITLLFIINSTIAVVLANRKLHRKLKT